MVTMEIKGLHHTAMIRRRKEVDPHIQNVAKESCTASLSEESFDDKNPIDSARDREAILKYDMGWQKRGSGRTYDSKSGVGTLIGNSTGKICAFGLRLSDCRICTNTLRKGTAEDIPEHDCNKNWCGSSKAMEPDVGIELIKSVEKEGVRVSTIIMDDDTTTVARIRQELEHTVTKWSDINHTSKHLTNSLFSLQKKHKSLNSQTIAYLKKCFSYALAQTKNNPVQSKVQIEQIVPHAFGEHENCGEWCGYKSTPDSYRHKTLRNDLTGQEVKQDLESVFNVFSQNAEKLAPGGSTKDVESFNSMIASKAPKRCHFSASGNLASRVGCAVAQKNLGNTYMTDIFKNIGLSPGHTFKKEAERRDSELKRHNIYNSKRENKLKKLNNKLQKRMKLCAKEKKEGTTYQTAVATTHPSDITSIPPVKRQPPLRKLNKLERLVFCDIETGSLAKDADILQISACAGDSKFNEYVLPSKKIFAASSKVTGLTEQDGVLFLHGSPVPAMPLKAVLKSFLKWLEQFSQAVLVGHNFKVFDFPRLLRAVSLVDLEQEFMCVCSGGIDTLPVFKALYPDLEKYTQEHLVSTILKEGYDAHNALEDVISLEKLYTMSNVSAEVALQHSFTVLWVFELGKFQAETTSNAETMHILADKKVISQNMIKKIACSGLKFQHLMTVFKKNGVNGLCEILSEKHCGKPRVTNCRKTIQALADFFTGWCMTNDKNHL